MCSIDDCPQTFLSLSSDLILAMWDYCTGVTLATVDLSTAFNNTISSSYDLPTMVTSKHHIVIFYKKTTFFIVLNRPIISSNSSPTLFQTSHPILCASFLSNGSLLLAHSSLSPSISLFSPNSFSCPVATFYLETCLLNLNDDKNPSSCQKLLNDFLTIPSKKVSL